MEDGIISGGFGARIAQYYGTADMKVLNCGFYQEVPTQFKAEEMLAANRLKPSQMAEDIGRVWQGRHKG